MALPRIRLVIEPPQKQRDRALLRKSLDVIASEKDAVKAQTIEAYNKWAEQLEALKTQYGQVWEVFGELGKIHGWHRKSRNAHQTKEWGPMIQTNFMSEKEPGKRRKGYAFYARVLYNGNSLLNDQWKEPLRSITISTGFDTYNQIHPYRKIKGIGDESWIGNGKLGTRLNGLSKRQLGERALLDACKGLCKQLRSSAIQYHVYWANAPCKRQVPLIKLNRSIGDILTCDLEADARYLVELINAAKHHEDIARGMESYFQKSVEIIK